MLPMTNRVPKPIVDKQTLGSFMGVEVWVDGPPVNNGYKQHIGVALVVEE